MYVCKHSLSFSCFGGEMGYSNMVGKYQLGRTIGEGTFAKVKLAKNIKNGQYVAIKIIDKHLILKHNLINQVQREIKTMKILNHPNIVKIFEVIGTKTKIYIVMEYVTGGQLSDKLSYWTSLHEKDARRHFQQLIDAIDHCHYRGVYHRDLKPQNLLLDSRGNVKVSDFGLSALVKQPGSLLSTSCGSPSYVAPEILTQKSYDGAAADVWSCGVILFELLAGYLPFEDSNLTKLYNKIYKAEYTFPKWFTEGAKNLFSRLIDPNPKTRITVAEIIEDPWFQTEYVPVLPIEQEEKYIAEDVHDAVSQYRDTGTESNIMNASGFINAFQLIAMSHDLDLSRLFEEQDSEKQKTKLGSEHTITETIEKIEAAARDASLSVERMNNSKVKMHSAKMIRCSRSCLELSAQVIEVAPKHCFVEVSKSEGGLVLYKEFCKSLSSLLSRESRTSTEDENPTQEASNPNIPT